MATRDDTREEAPGVTPEEFGDLRTHVLSLARRITHLAESDEDVEVEDPELSHRLAHSVKPYVDRLVALRHLLNPVGRIIEKRERIEGLREEIADDIASVEDASQDLGESVDVSLITELQTELAAVKRDRKLFADEDEDEEHEGPEDADDDEGADLGPTDASDPESVSAPAAARRPGRRSLADRPVDERLRLVLGPRFIDLERLEGIFGQPLVDDDLATARAGLETVWDGLLRIERFGHHVRQQQLAPLRRALQDYVLLYRTPVLPTADGGVPCTIGALKEAFPTRFVGASERSLWYASLPFYRETVAEGHWALLDRQYLNCTFRQPKIRLTMYARANDLPTEALRQKSVVEDIYDRTVADAATESLYFDNCNSLTRTTYQQKDEPAKKQVHVYYRDGQIRISGKRGLPHWRPGKPRWPGVLPAIVFASRSAA